jgi:DMSO/TMAO reductase YedYZ molybdopterin-dependent catalytic subunit
VASSDDAGTPIGRRILLGMLGAGAVGIAFGDRIQSGVERVMRPITQHDPTGLTEFVPTAGRFRIYSVTANMPRRNAADYRLKVAGMVDHPFDLTLAELQAMPATNLTRDFQCVTGWRVQDVHWTGVTLADLLDRAGVKDGAKALRLFSFDGSYTESLTMDQARRPDVIAAYRMLGGPVSRDHGGPVRLYVAPMYGYKSLKWLDRIEVTDQVVPGYWEDLGYDVDGWVGRSNGRDDAPTST